MWVRQIFPRFQPTRSRFKYLPTRKIPQTNQQTLKRYCTLPPDTETAENPNFVQPDIPKIMVLGIGGGGTNAVNEMILRQLTGVDFVVCNTDSQALEQSVAVHKIQLGRLKTRGLGAGSDPRIGKEAMEENLAEVISHVETCGLVFLAAGMGGGTGTGATPVIAKALKARNILTVAIVTTPFEFESSHRMRTAIAGVEELSKIVDTNLVIPNQRLFSYTGIGFKDSFKLVDEVLYRGVKSISDLLTIPGFINTDFADVSTILKDSGNAVLGYGIAAGPDRATRAVRDALDHQLLKDIEIKGATRVLMNITSGNDLSVQETSYIADFVSARCAPHVNLIFGVSFVENMEELSVSIIISGLKYSNKDYLRVSPGKVVPPFIEPMVRDSKVKPKNQKENLTLGQWLKAWF